MKNIIIYWMRWVGKTTIGRLLGDKTGMLYYDLDVVIQDTIGTSIFDFIEQYGWEKFREKEHETLVQILQKKEDKIVSLWWWTILFENNQTVLLRQASKLIYLQAPLCTIHDRVKTDEDRGNKRNALTWTWLLEELTQLYEERKWIYESFYDFKVQNNTSSEQTVDTILASIGYWGICIPITNFCLDDLSKQIELINTTRKIKRVELRIDCIQEINYEEIYARIKTIKKQVIITNRMDKEWGHYTWNYADSLKKLQQFCPYGDHVDIELSAWDTIHQLKEIIDGKKLILSYHNFISTPDLSFLKEKISAMSMYNPDTYKIAVMPNTKEDVDIIYQLQEYFSHEYKGKEFIFISMWDLGKETRTTMPRKWWLLTFGTLQDISAPWQIPYWELHKMIYWEG